jgi:hypothetical protein
MKLNWDAYVDRDCKRTYGTGCGCEGLFREAMGGTLAASIFGINEPDVAEAMVAWWPVNFSIDQGLRNFSMIKGYAL